MYKKNIQFDLQIFGFFSSNKKRFAKIINVNF